MSTTLRLTVGEYEQMVARGAFADLKRRIELIHGELLEMSPAGPIHDDYIRYLLQWALTTRLAIPHPQMGIRIGDHLPEPDLALIQPKRYANERPTQDDVLLLVEVADSSLSYDLNEKARLYAENGIAEYWVVDVAGSKLHRHCSPMQGNYGQIDVLQSPGTVAARFDSELLLDLQDFFLQSMRPRESNDPQSGN